MRKYDHRRWKRELARAVFHWASGDLESLLESIFWLKPGGGHLLVSRPLFACVLRRLAKRNPGIVDFQRTLAGSLLAMRRYDEAIAACDEGLAELAAMLPSAPLSSLRVEKRFLRGRHSRRNREILSLLVGSPESARGELWTLKGHAALLSGDPDAALRAWERGLRSADAATRPLAVDVCRKVIAQARLFGDTRSAEVADRRLSEFLAALETALV